MNTYRGLRKDVAPVDSEEVTTILVVAGWCAVLFGILTWREQSTFNTLLPWQGAGAMMAAGVLLLLGGVALVGALVVKGVVGPRR